MTLEEYMNNVKGKSLEDLTRMVKESTEFQMYVDEVKKGNSMALDMLKVHILLKSISDDKFGNVFTSVSTDLTVALIDQRLRNEILKGDKYDNQYNN